MNIEFITKKDLLEFQKIILSRIGEVKQNQLQFLRSKKVCKMLDISPTSLYRLREGGILPCTKVKGSYFYNVNDIKELMNRNKLNRL